MLSLFDPGSPIDVAAARHAQPRAFIRCRRGSSGLEYAVFAGMLGLTLVIMFQLFGGSLTNTLGLLSGKGYGTAATTGPVGR